MLKPKREKTKSLVRSELNLEQNSVFTVSTYRKKSREIVIRETGPAGEITERKAVIGRTVDGIETGVLTTHHFKVYLALVELWEKAERPIHEPVHFTILKIIKRLGLADSGKNYEDIKRQLLSLSQIPLTFIDSFFIPKEGGFRSLKPFTILDYLHIYERGRVGKQRRTRGYGKFRFHLNILENLITNHTHPLRLDVIKSFKRHKDLAILLYTYLDRNLAFKDKYEIRLKKLFDHLDLSQAYIRYPSERKKRLIAVTKELEGKPLSTGILSYCRIHKTEDGKDYKLISHKRPFGRLPEAKKQSPARLTTSKPDMVAALTEHGLTEGQVEELLKVTGEEIITIQLEALPYRLKRYEDRGEEANKVAILYRSIKENWSLPQTYLEKKTEEEREKRAKHYVLWMCRNPDCQNSRTIIYTPKEHGRPLKCFRCGSSIEIVDEDFKEYQEG